MRYKLNISSKISSMSNPTRMNSENSTKTIIPKNAYTQNIKENWGIIIISLLPTQFTRTKCVKALKKHNLDSYWDIYVHEHIPAFNVYHTLLEYHFLHCKMARGTIYIFEKPFGFLTHIVYRAATHVSGLCHYSD